MVTRISLSVFGIPLNEYGPIAVRAEELGFTGLWLGEHLLHPVKVTDRYPYPEAGRVGLGADTPLFDVWSMLAYLAALTNSMQLGAGVYIAPLRHPIQSALSAATCQKLSDGRLLLGVGAGWQREEFHAVGVPFSERGVRLDECIDAMRLLWSGEPAAFRGSAYEFSNVQSGIGLEVGVPIVVGGASHQALRRAARVGDGWYGPPASLDESKAAVEEIQRLRGEYGTLDREFRTLVRLPEKTSGDVLGRYLAAGLHDLVIAPWLTSFAEGSLDRRLSELSEVADCLGIRR